MINKNYLRKLRARRGRIILRKSQIYTMSIFKSNKHIYLSVHSYDRLKNILSISTLNNHVKFMLKNRKHNHIINILVDIFVTLLRNKNITHVIFDRSGYRFCGKVKKIYKLLKIKKVLFEK